MNLIKNNWKRIYLLARKAYSFIPYNFLRGYAFPPLSVILLITYRCNLKCKHCFYNKDFTSEKILNQLSKNRTSELSTQEIKDLIDDLKKMYVKNITIHGGEPLVRKDLFEIIEYAHSKGLRTNISTNATLIDEETAKKIISSNLDCMSISLEGSEEINDAVRGKGNFKKTLRGLQLLNKYKKDKPRINLGCTISSINHKDLFSLVEIAKENKIDTLHFNGVTWNSERNIKGTKNILSKVLDYKKVEIGTENISDNIIKEIDAKKILEEKQKIKDYIKKNKLNVFFPPFENEQIINDYFTNDQHCFSNSCNYKWISTVISPYGYVYPCIPVSFMNLNLGNIREEKLSEIWNSKKYKELRNTFKKAKKFPICNKCCEMDPSPKLK